MPVKDYPNQNQTPSNLKLEEMATPELVFQNLFQYAHFPEIVEMLNKIRQWLFNKEYPHALGTREHINMLFFFEKIQSAIEAAKIIEQRQNGNQLDMNIFSMQSLFHKLMDKADTFYDAANHIKNKNQNEICCHLLHKAAKGTYNALLMATIGTMEDSLDLKDLATKCSKVFKDLPNPFIMQGSQLEYLRLLTTTTLSGIFKQDFKIDDEAIEYLLKEVNTIRINVCGYYDTKAEELGRMS